MNNNSISENQLLNAAGTPIHIEYINKRNSSAIIRNGSINLRISKHLNNSQRNEHIRTLLKNLATYRSKQPHDVTKMNNINAFGYFPTDLTWVKSAQKNTTYSYELGALTIKYNPENETAEKLKQKLVDRLTKYLQTDLTNLINTTNQQTVNKKINKISWQNFQARWGHCQKQRKELAFAKKLIWCPAELTEYVIIHELCHLIQADHSTKYWQLVENYYPNFKSARRQLTDYQ